MSGEPIYYKSCRVKDEYYDRINRALHWQDMLLSSVIPSCLIFIGNGLMIYHLAKAQIQRRKTMHVDNQNQSGSSSITLMLVTVSVRPHHTRRSCEGTFHLRSCSHALLRQQHDQFLALLSEWKEIQGRKQNLTLVESQLLPPWVKHKVQQNFERELDIDNDVTNIPRKIKKLYLI